MSGLEVAGVVLGALPLIIAALEQYAQGANTVKRFWRYKPEIRSLILQVKTEYQIYLNILEQLLTGIVRTEHMSEFVHNTDSDAWRDMRLNNALEKRLSEAYEVYLDNVRAMRVTLKMMMKTLALDSDGKTQIADPSDANLFKQQYKRLKFSLSQSSYEKQLHALRFHNQNLSDLTRQSLILEKTRTEGKARACPNFQALRGYARDLYNTLRAGLNCSSGCPDHAVNLRLESRSKEPKEEDFEQTAFRVVFRRASSNVWKEAEIRCIANKPKAAAPSDFLPSTNVSPASGKRVHFNYLDPAVQRNPSVRSTTITIPRPTLSAVSNLSRIHNLCAALQQFQNSPSTLCLGYLLDHDGRKHGIYPVRCQGSGGHQWTSCSLEQVLERQSTTGIRLTQADKLRIAVCLASSVLQLYRTPWLDEAWGHKDVYFVYQSGTPPSDVSIRPYVHRNLSPTAATPASPPQHSNSVILNQTLYDLGILLIELWYGRTIEQLAIDADQICQGTPGTSWCTAERLIKTDFQFEAGALYASVVRRCLRCDFDRTDMDLAKESFQKDVFNGVVRPLQTNFERFINQSLDPTAI